MFKATFSNWCFIWYVNYIRIIIAKEISFFFLLNMNKLYWIFMCKNNVDSTDFFSRENDCWLGVKYGYMLSGEATHTNFIVISLKRPANVVSSIPLRRDLFHTTLCDKVWQWLAAGRWFSPGTLVSLVVFSRYFGFLGGFLQVLWFPRPIKLTATIQLKYCWKCR